MSVQMSQVLPLTKDKAAYSELQLAFLAKKLTAVLKAGVGLEGERSIKVQGRLLVSLCGEICVYMCVCDYCM